MHAGIDLQWSGHREEEGLNEVAGMGLLVGRAAGRRAEKIGHTGNLGQREQAGQPPRPRTGQPLRLPSGVKRPHGMYRAEQHQVSNSPFMNAEVEEAQAFKVIHCC